MMKNKTYYPFYFAVVLLVGILIGQRMMVRPSSDMSSDNKINNALEYIQNNYVDSIKLKEVEESVIEDMLTKLDPHSVYISEEDFNAANDPLMGKFDGIGVQFRMVKDSVVVIMPLENGPSQKAGILAGDRIIIANQDTLAGKNYSSIDIQKHLKGKRGSLVNLWIKRQGEKDLIPFNLKRAAIPTYSIDAKFMLDKQTGYIKLSRFSATTIDEFAKALNDLNDSGMHQLILDLRGNSGGYLGAAVYIADQFLEKDRDIVYTEGRNRPKQIYKASGESNVIKDPLIILQDENSASAAEIVAGAIQDNDRGLIVGRRSFGKGLVQEQMNYTDGSAVRLTVARYYTPSGRSIQRPYTNGTDEYYNDYYKRIHSIALLAPDSSNINDSLKYKTYKGRTVYGGGGIWPDFFITADTSINFTFYNQLLNQAIIYQFAFNYVDKNREQLAKYKSVESFQKNFHFEDVLYNQLMDLPQVKALKPSAKDKTDSKSYIQNLLKAEIARNLFEDGFYPIYIQNDRFIKEALILFKKDSIH